MTESEKIICRMYLSDLDRIGDCNEYDLLMDMINQEPAVLDKNNTYGAKLIKRVREESHLINEDDYKEISAIFNRAVERENR